MSKCLLVSAIAFAVVVTAASDSGEFSSSDESSGAVPPPPYDPTFAGGCPWNGVKDGMITSLLTYAQGKYITVADEENKLSYEFSPCRRQADLGMGCTQEEGQNVSLNAGLVVKKDNKCSSQSDIFFATAEPSFENDGWVIMYKNFLGVPFNLTIMCEADGATNKLINNGANFLTVGDARACPVKAAEVAPFNVSVDACSATFDDSSKTTELNSFSSWFVMTFLSLGVLPDVYINTCSTRSFSDSSHIKGCGNTEGYFAFTEAGQCTVLDQRVATFYPDGEFGQYWMNHYYTEQPKKTTGHGFQQQAEETETIARDVVVSCGTAESFVGKSADGNTFYFTSPGACGVASTPVPSTNAPSQKPKSGLTTGEVVGIVIGALALIVIILVCLRWRSAKGEEEGEYQRV